MAVISGPTSPTTTIAVTRNAEVVIQSFARSATTQLYTVTLGSGTPTDTGTAEEGTNPVNVASVPNSSGLSQEALGGVIGGIVGAIVLILFTCVCCSCLKGHNVQTQGTVSSRSSSRSASASGGSSGSRSRSSSEGDDWEDGREPDGTAPVPGGPLPPGAMPPRVWGGGPPPGMGPPPGAFPMSGIGRGGPPPMMGRSPMPGRAGPPPSMAY